MVKYIKLTNVLFLFTFAFLLVSCSDDDNTGTTSYNENRTIIEAAQRTTALNSFVEALTVADGNLISTLNGSGPFTVFAPTDIAFDDLASQLGFDNAGNMLDQINKELLTQLLNYHVVVGNNVSSGLSDGQSITTQQGEDITISIVDDKIFVQDLTELSSTNTAGEVIVPDQTTANGVLHFVNKVLIPQAAIDALSIDIRPNLTELVVDTAALSLLEEAVIKAGLAGTLSGDGPFTVFAPTNDAFTNLLDFLGDDYNDIDDFDNAIEIELLKSILLYHVIPSEINAADLQPGNVLTAFTNNSIEVISNAGSFEIGDVTMTNATITATDIDGINGVVHTIDKVLLPQAALDFLDLLGSDDLVTVVTNTPTLSILEEAIIKTGLTDTLDDITNQEVVDDESTADIDESENTGFTYYKPATVFAPSDTAFQDLFGALGANYNSIADFDTDEEIALLKNILLYHVTSGAIKAADLSVGDITTALDGSSLEVIARGSTFVLGDATNDINAQFTANDVIARNGIAHIIDKVLLPQEAVLFIDSL